MKSFGFFPMQNASFGVSMTQSKDTQTAWFNRADRALYLAKESGKNSVEYV